jgi:L-fucono-1,5-lactonase
VAGAPVPTGGLVDAHHHVWDIAARPQPWLELPGNEPLRRDFSLEDLRPGAQEAGVSATVAVQTVAEPGETGELLALAARGDLVAGVVGWVDLESPGVAGELAALAGGPHGRFLSGIRHPVLTEDDPGWLRRPAVLRGLAAVAEAGLCYDIVARPRQLPAAAGAAAAVPGLTFVLDHLGNPDTSGPPDPDWVASVRALAALPNVVCKLSGVLGERPPGSHKADGGPAHLWPFWRIVFEGFGAGRLMFGSDWPVCTLAATYRAVVADALALTAGLNQASRDAVLAGNARRVYRLGSPRAGQR